MFTHLLSQLTSSSVFCKQDTRGYGGAECWARSSSKMAGNNGWRMLYGLKPPHIRPLTRGTRPLHLPTNKPRKLPMHQPFWRSTAGNNNCSLSVGRSNQSSLQPQRAPKINDGMRLEWPHNSLFPVPPGTQT
jgi:hypothetical protein